MKMRGQVSEFWFLAFLIAAAFIILFTPLLDSFVQTAIQGVNPNDDTAIILLKLLVAVPFIVIIYDAYRRVRGSYVPA